MDTKFVNINDDIEKLKRVIDSSNLEESQVLVAKIFIKDELVEKFLRFVDWSRNEELLYY